MDGWDHDVHMNYEDSHLLDTAGSKGRKHRLLEETRAEHL